MERPNKSANMMTGTTAAMASSRGNQRHQADEAPAKTQRERCAVDRAQSDRGGGRTADVDRRAGARGRDRDHVVAQGFDEAFGGGFLRSGGGYDGDQRR